MERQTQYLLAIDTALKKGSMSLFSGSDEIGRWAGNEAVSRSEDLVAGMDKMLVDNGITARDLDRIVVSVGPGSFTGLRVGIAAAKGLAKALACQLRGVPVLDAMAFAVALEPEREGKRAVGAMIGAGGVHVYARVFRKVDDVLLAATGIEMTDSPDRFFVDETYRDLERIAVDDAISSAHIDSVRAALPNVLFVPFAELAKYIGLYDMSTPHLGGNEVLPIYVREL